MDDETELETWPEEIRLHEKGARLAVTFDNGESFDFTAEFLRVTSPSAEVQGHHPSQRQTVPGKKNVRITRIEPLGNYAVKLVFDDGHDTGLFTWEYFLDVGRNMDFFWKDYLERMEDEGLQR